MNNVTLTGNLCRDFELRTTNSGNSVASNTIAVRRDRKEADGTYASDFFDIYLFGAQADYAVKWLRKGDKVGVSGNIHIRDYTTRNGSKGRAVEITVNNIENLMPKEDVSDAQAQDTPAQEAPQAQAQPTSAPTQDVPTGTTGDQLDLPDDDLPF